MSTQQNLFFRAVMETLHDSVETFLHTNNLAG